MFCPPQVGEFTAQRRVDVEKRPFLAFVGRAAYPETLATQGQRSAQVRVLAVGDAHRQRVELGVSRHVQTVARRTELQRALGLVIGAHHEDVEVLQEVAGDGEEDAIAAQVVGPDATVGHRQPHARP
jgi:hypothetical protein